MKTFPIAGILSLVLLSLAFNSARAQSLPKASAKEIRSDSMASLKHLYATNEKAKELGKRAKGVLIFPHIIKGGFVFGGSFGNGAYVQDGKVTAYYNTTAASYGLQAGIQKYGYALFLMDDDAVNAMNASGGWEIGSAPSLTVVDDGVAASLSTTTINKGTYAFFFDQTGLMGGLGLEGSKITRINPEN